MTNEEYKKITELEYKAKQCRAAGIDPEIDDGTAWAMTHTRECRMVTDGQRFWEQPRLILEFDVFQGGVVTMRCYLRNIPKLPRAVIEKTHASVAGDDLLYRAHGYGTGSRGGDEVYSNRRWRNSCRGFLRGPEGTARASGIWHALRDANSSRWI